MGNSMVNWMDASVAALLAWLSVPQMGLGAVFVVSFVSATLLPLGSEPAVFGLVKWQPQLMWPAIAVATVGNTLGGLLTWWMGRMARSAADHVRAAPARGQATASRWLLRFGPKACLLSWLPVVGDPLCAVAGWMNLPLGACFTYMAMGKFARYVTATYLLMKWL